MEDTLGVEKFITSGLVGCIARADMCLVECT